MLYVFQRVLVDQSYQKIANYMADNKSKLNHHQNHFVIKMLSKSSKTHILVLQPGQRQRFSDLQLDTGIEIISPSGCEKHKNV